MNVGSRIRELRHTRSLSQYKLAKLSGVAQSFVHEIESGQKSPTVRTLEKLARALGVSVAVLVGDDAPASAGGVGGGCGKEGAA